MSLKNPENALYWVEKCLMETDVDRVDFLNTHCGHDPLLLKEVSELLVAYEQVGDFLETPLANQFYEILDEFDKPPECIDVYSIVRELGSGGMGAVYLAEQSHPMQRMVALKMLKMSVANPQMLARFAMEYQMLAKMNHANIASVLDAGVWEQRPYFTMEYVDGMPMDQYCNEEGLGLQQRLDLFIQACEGVAHAHHKGIIHRDLKPINILVEMSERSARVKVIDFGIAKTLEHAGFQKGQLVITRAFQIMGTPPYMSPEQMDGSTGKLDTRADIYGLGAVLYQLVTGKPPFDANRLASASLSEKIKIIHHEVPPKPSSFSQNMQNRRPLGLKKLTRELDWIILKALSKNPTDRYQTVQEMIEDIHRFMLHKPLSARPPSLRYRLGKFVRRNFGRLLVAVALVSSLILVIAKNMEASQSRNSAELLEDFTSSMLVVPNPYGEDPARSIQTLLSRWEELFGGRFADFPVREAKLRYNIANSQASLGLYEQAGKNIARSLHLRETHLGPEDPLTLLTRARSYFYFYQAGMLDLAEKGYQQLLPLSERVLGSRDALTLKIRRGQANVFMAQGFPDKARVIYEELLNLFPQETTRDKREYLVTLNVLGNAYRVLGEVTLAEQCYKQALAGFTALTSPTYPDTLAVRSNLIVLMQDQGNHLEAAELLPALISDRSAAFGPRHPETLKAQSNLAHSFNELGRYEEAEQLLTKTLALQESILGDDHIDTIQTVNNLSMAYAGRSDLESAIKLLKPYAKRSSELFGFDHTETVKLHNNLADYLIRRNEVAAARDLLLDMLPKIRVAQGKMSRVVMFMQCTLAESHMELGELDRSRILLESLVGDAGKVFDEKSVYPYIFKGLLGRNKMLEGDKKGAEELLSKAWAWLHSRKHPMTEVFGEYLHELKEN